MNRMYIYIKIYKQCKKKLCEEVYPDASMIAFLTEKHLYWN